MDNLQEEKKEDQEFQQRQQQQAEILKIAKQKRLQPIEDKEETVLLPLD